MGASSCCMWCVCFDNAQTRRLIQKSFFFFKVGCESPASTYVHNANVIVNVYRAAAGAQRSQCCAADSMPLHGMTASADDVATLETIMVYQDGLTESAR